MRFESERTKVDLTPMLDVVFIMLIFFVVTATFVTESGVDVNPPDQSNPPPNPLNNAILVNVTANNRYIIGTEDVDVRLLRARFERLSAANPKAPVIINPHSLSSANALIRVMDSARQAGVFETKLAHVD